MYIRKSDNSKMNLTGGHTTYRFHLNDLVFTYFRIRRYHDDFELLKKRQTSYQTNIPISSQTNPFSPWLRKSIISLSRKENAD
jgi:hypothetical protein